jgi:hypothetical protein
MEKLTKEKLNKVYDILVTIGDAYESDRDSFVYTHNKYTLAKV